MREWAERPKHLPRLHTNDNVQEQHLNACFPSEHNQDTNASI